jgi:DedD protein
MAAEELRGDSLKQRLVGGIALLVIGVVAWFWLLSGDSPVDPVSRTTEIPPAPDIQPFEVPQPTPPANIEPVKNERESPPALRAQIAADKPAPVASPEPSRPATVSKPAVQKAQPAAEKAPPAKPKDTFELDQQGLPVAWVVQVGLFSTQASADKVKASLQQKGFKAYTEPYKTPNAPNGFKVFVGPKLSREQADGQKTAIDAALKVNSKIVRFQPPQR